MTIQLDSQDLLDIIKGLISKDVADRRSNYRPQYRNPYHPEDGLSELYISKELFTNRSDKSTKSNNDALEQKIDSENEIFLNDPNKISEDELEENNIETITNRADVKGKKDAQRSL